MRVGAPRSTNPPTVFRLGDAWWLAFDDHAIRMDLVKAIRRQYSETNQRWESVVFTDLKRRIDGTPLAIATEWTLRDFMHPQHPQQPETNG